MTSKQVRLIGMVLLFGGLLFMLDVLSPFTPTPQAPVPDLLGILFCLVIAFTSIRLFQPVLPRLPVPQEHVHPELRGRQTTWICVLLC